MPQPIRVAPEQPTQAAAAVESSADRFPGDRGRIQLYGECRDMDHKVVNGQSSYVDITDLLTS